MLYNRLSGAPVQVLEPQTHTTTIAPPTRGLVLNENLTRMGPGAAVELENWFPTLTGARVRGGSSLHATIGSDPVKSIFCHRSGSTETMFAADDSAIYDITTPADAEAAPTADVSSQTSGDYSWVQFGTVASEYLYLVNGADDAQLYDGASWQALNSGSSPAVTGVATADLSHVWTYANRLFFVEGGTMSAWYLPVDSLGGAATEFSLAGVFQKGGALLTGATWAVDADAFRLPSKCCFISTEGEVAVYQGSDPSTAATWSLIGRYEIGKPLGKNAVLPTAGDLLVATHEGIVPMSMVVQRDPALLSLSAVTRTIEPLWREQVKKKSGTPWQIAKWPKEGLAMVTLPDVTNEDYRCFVANINSGAWAVYTGWDARSVGVCDEQMFFGTSAGTIMKAEDGGNDNGVEYVCKYAGGFDHLSAPGRLKSVSMARAIFVASTTFEAKLSMSVNYKAAFPPAPGPITSETLSVWDSATWDTSEWDGPSRDEVTTNWVSIARNALAAAPQVQITCDQTLRPDVELAAFDVLCETGGVVT